MTKDTFLQDLEFLSKEDIDRIIKEKGKPRKPVNPFIDLTLFKPDQNELVDSRKLKS